MSKDSPHPVLHSESEISLCNIIATYLEERGYRIRQLDKYAFRICGLNNKTCQYWPQIKQEYDPYGDYHILSITREAYKLDGEVAGYTWKLDDIIFGDLERTLKKMEKVLKSWIMINYD